ncbi:MAG: DegV family protein [Candidatus Woesearchaeota archaeon]
MSSRIFNQTKKCKIILSGGDFLEDFLSVKDFDLKVEKVDLKLTIESPLNKNTISASETELEKILNDDYKTEKLISELGINPKSDFYELSSRERFYEILRILGPGSIRTSQPNEFDFKKSLEDIENHDLIVISTISSKLSGTYQSALMAVNQLPENDKNKIYVVDSKSVSKMVGYSALRGLEDILKNNFKNDYDYSSEVFMRGLIFDLRYIDVGGRGEVLKHIVKLISTFKIVPLITLENGNIKLLNVLRGEKKPIIAFSENLFEELNKNKEQYDNAVLIYTSKNTKERLGEVEELLNKNKIKSEYVCSDFVLGTHFGTESVGYFVYKR